MVELNKKLVGLKKELDEKVDLLIKQGMTVQDPLQARQSIIAELLNIDSEIIDKSINSDKSAKIIQSVGVPSTIHSKLNLSQVLLRKQ